MANRGETPIVDSNIITNASASFPVSGVVDAAIAKRLEKSLYRVEALLADAIAKLEKISK